MTATGLPQRMPSSPARTKNPRDRVFWSLLLGVALLDIATKRWAEGALGLHSPEEVIGHWLRFTLTYNTGAAMNLSVGGASRIVFSLIAVGMLAYLFKLYRDAHPTERATPAALALISAGAFGNLVDRLRHAKGVVDFIDVGTADWRFYTFNVADVGVTSGAILLALLMWRTGEKPSVPAAADAMPATEANPDQGPSR
jgi:signal peptidase II